MWSKTASFSFTPTSTWDYTNVDVVDLDDTMTVFKMFSYDGGNSFWDDGHDFLRFKRNILG